MHEEAEPITFDRMPQELICQCLSWLGSRDLASACATCASTRQAALDVWDEVIVREDGLALELLRRAPAAGPSIRRYTQVTKRAEALQALDGAGWCQVGTTQRRDRLPGQEGHSSVLLDDRWWLVVCGFTDMGLTNSVFVCDTWALERGEALTWRRLRSEGEAPRRKYGHSACSVGELSLALLGGVRYGGYRGDVSDCHVLQLSLAPPHAPHCVWRELRSDEGGACTSRAYSSLTRVPAACLGGGVASHTHGACLLAFGGIHDGAAIDALEQLPLGDATVGGAAVGDAAVGGRPAAATVAWAALATSGTAPCARFGHSAHLHARTNRLLVVGGSDGSDLLRNGDDFHPMGATDDASSGDGVFSLQLETLQWSRLRVRVPPGSGLAPTSLLIGGQCHTSALVHDRVLLFGGGVPNRHAHRRPPPEPPCTHLRRWARARVCSPVPSACRLSARRPSRARAQAPT